jgi:Uma2 family endonuclease
MLHTDDPALHRLSVEDVLRMYETGVLTPEERVELIDGVLVDVSPPGADHASIVSWLTRHFVIGCADSEVRIQDHLLVAGGFVLPDLMVVEPVPRGSLPSTATLVVEVAVTTQRHDTAKALRYARAGVDEYWLVDVVARTVRVHEEPSADGYRRVVVHDDRAVLSPPADAPPVAVGDMLGPAAPQA